VSCDSTLEQGLFFPPPHQYPFIRLTQLPFNVLITLRLCGAVPPRVSYLELSTPMLLLLLTAWPIQGRLAADGYELPFRLAHGDQRLLTLRHVVLPYRIVTREVTRVDSREVGRLQAA
jgi:hypothetical protein